jgi:hypothetical protein
MFKRVAIFTVIVVFLLGAFRMVSSFFIGEYVKEYVEQIPVLNITVGKVKAFPDTGEVTFKNFKIFDVKFKEATELKFSCRNLIINFRWWQSAGNKFLIADVLVDTPKFWVLSRKDFRDSIVEKTIRKLMNWGQTTNKRGIKIDFATFRVKNGTLYYEDDRSTPTLKLKMVNINGLIKDAGFESPRKTRGETTSFKGSGYAENSADVSFQGNMKLTGNSGFYGASKIDINGLNLKSMSPLTNRYGDFEYKDGKFDMHMEVKIKDDMFTGFATSTFKDIQVQRWAAVGNVDEATNRFWARIGRSNMKPVKTDAKNSRTVRIDLNYPLDQFGDEWWAHLGSMLKLSVARTFVPPYN